MGLTFAAIPQYADIPDAQLSGTEPLTDFAIQQVSANAKFAAVRLEIIFVGFYGHGDTILAPVSPVDGYQYLQSECMFAPMIYSNRSRMAPYTPGQLTPPPQSDTQSGNNEYNFPGEWDINDLTGVVKLKTSYYSAGGAEVVTTDGIIKVYAICQRSSITVAD